MIEEETTTDAEPGVEVVPEATPEETEPVAPETIA